MSSFNAVFLIAKCFAERGVDVILDADGTRRHHSKRAHQDRVASKDRLRIELLGLRASLGQLIHQPNPTDEIIAEKDELTKTIKTKEKQYQRSLPSDFVVNLEKLAQSWTSKSKNGVSISLERSLWQADPTIAKRAIDGDIDAILSGDSDFAMYVGTGGKDGMADIMIRNPSFTSKRDSIKTLEIWTGQKRVAEYINGVLDTKIGEDTFPETPPHPIFDGLNSFRARALLAIGVGCDALPGGINQFGARRAMEVRKKIEDAMMKVRKKVDWTIVMKQCGISVTNYS
mmetsp:Transcript_15112/g.37013  ORF Transcript_15112/g.37013 Transcript_15112/m.37013 type:complete len:286 (-) Transcript_15112:335-1192(-)